MLRAGGRMAKKFFSLFLFLGLVFSGVAQEDRTAAPDIKEVLAALPGVTSKEIFAEGEFKIPEGYRCFELKILQPVDHFTLGSASFTQRLVLLHKDATAPLVLQTSGYKIFKIALSGIALTFGTNQLQVEHRFFDQSVPAVLDWSKLDVAQSANDFHRIVQTLKKVYAAPWVGTGASKGGMTSVYHRRFFPQDLSGTVADVAPLSFSTMDPRYVDFVDNAGGPNYEGCRSKLQALQLALLGRRQEIYPLIQGSFVLLGGKSVAFEHAVIEMPYAFWQYKNPEDPKLGCAQVPAPDGPAKDLAEFLAAVNDVADYGEPGLLNFMPYYYQAGTQLGGPAARTDRLAPFLLHPYTLDQYMPPGVPHPYSNALMHDVKQWVETEADRILFVYGEFDPWTAGAFPKTGGAGKDFHWLMVPGGNHSSTLVKLTGDAKSEALAALTRWLGKSPLRSVEGDDLSTLETLELDARRAGHLP